MSDYLNADGTPKLNVVHCCDWRDLLGALVDNSADCILADMPYGTTACAWDTMIDLGAWWQEAHRVAKPRAAIVCTGSQPFTSRLIMSNIERFKYCWVWVKTKASDHINAKNKPMKKYEDVIVFSSGTTANKSDKRMSYYPQGLTKVDRYTFRPNRDVALSRILGVRPSHKKGWVQEFEDYPNDVLEFANPNNNNDHPTQKPVALFEYLIRTYTLPGDLVVDPFVGSGTTALAARNTGRRFICGDLDAGYVETARARLALPYTPNMFDTPPAQAETPTQRALFGE